LAKQERPLRKPPARRGPSLAGRALRFVSLVATGSAVVLAAPALARRFLAGQPPAPPEMVGGGRAPAPPPVDGPFREDGDQPDAASAAPPPRAPVREADLATTTRPGEPAAEIAPPASALRASPGEVLLDWRPADMDLDAIAPVGEEEPDPEDRGVILPWRPDGMTHEAAPPAPSRPTMRRRRASRLYYGWVVTIAAAIGFGVSAGIGNWGFGAFVRPLEAEFGWSRGEVSAAASIGMAAILLGSLPAGWWVDRLGARSAIAFGAVGTAIGFVALSQVQTLWQFYAVFAVTAFFRTFTTYIPLIAIVGLWFPGSSGRAMGLIMAGLGMGGVVFAPIATGLIEAFGWRQAYVILGFVMGGYFLPAALLVMRGPGRARIAGETAAPRVLEGWAFGEALRSPAFWLLNLGIAFMWTGQVGFISHAQPLFEWRGYDPETAAAFVSLAALCATVTRLVAGWIYVRMRRPALFSFAMGTLAAVGLANLLPPVSQVTLVAFFALWGIGSGAMVLLPPTLTADTYGQRSLGKLLAFTEVVGGVGSVGGPIVGGILFDSTGSYVAPFLVYVLATLAAGLALVVFVRAHKPRAALLAREVAPVPLAEPG